MEIISIIMIIIALFAFAGVVMKARKGDVSLPGFIFWSILWVCVIIIALLPATASIIASFFGIGRGVDVLIYTSIPVLFYLIFRIYLRIEKQEQELTLLVRKLALKRK